MRAARDSRGWSLDRLAYETSLRLPGDRHVTSEALRRMELGLVKELDLVITAAIDDANAAIRLRSMTEVALAGDEMLRPVARPPETASIGHVEHGVIRAAEIAEARNRREENAVRATDH